MYPKGFQTTRNRPREKKSADGKNVISPVCQSQSFHYTLYDNVNDIKKLWEKLRKALIQQDMMLGIRTEMTPSKKPA